MEPKRNISQKAAWRPSPLRVNTSTPTEYFHSQIMLAIGKISNYAVGIAVPDLFISFFVFTLHTKA